MALKVKAVERLLKFDKNDPGSYRYVLKPELYTSLDQKKVIREAALRSGVSQGVMKACWDAAGEVIKAWATEGHAVALPGLGSLITSRRIIFTPSVDLKDELATTGILITCYDRTGKEVKRVTSTDPGTIEDNEAGNSPSAGSGTDSGTDPSAGSGTVHNGSGIIPTPSDPEDDYPA